VVVVGVVVVVVGGGRGECAGGRRARVRGRAVRAGVWGVEGVVVGALSSRVRRAAGAQASIEQRMRRACSSVKRLEQEALYRP
jgi:hypothetical protein